MSLSNKLEVWRGIFWKITSCGCFAAINVIVRYLSGGAPLQQEQVIPIHIIMLFQNCFGTLAILPLMQYSQQLNKASLLKPKFPLLNSIRILTAIFGVAFWYLSLKFMPIVQVVALSFIVPVLTLIGAVIFLKERLDGPRKLAVFLSLLGGYLIIRPNLTFNFTISWKLCLPLIAALIFALDKLITRKLLADGASPESLTLYLLLAMGPACLVPCAIYGWEFPSTYNMLWLVLLGLLAGMAHLSFSKAYALAEVTFLMPYGLTKILFCGLFGYIAFAESPNGTNMWLGLFTVVFSTILLGYKSNNCGQIKPQLQ